MFEPIQSKIVLSYVLKPFHQSCYFYYILKWALCARRYENRKQRKKVS